MTSLELRHRLLFAIASASVGCREHGIATVDTEPHDAASTTTIIDATLPVTAASSAGNAPPSLPVVPPVASSAPKPNTLCGGAQTHQLCFQPRTGARSQGTGEPAPPPPPSAFNAQGCLPKDMVSDSCCMGPAAGPQFRGGECCYTFCPTTVCCGRPFIVRGRARLAPLRRGSDWTSNVHVDVASIDARARDVIANAWLEDARMEHASAAAFGRFVVQLVALGAPPDLVADAARAASDEVTHATLAFTLAAHMSGFASAPSPMDLNGAFDARTLDAVIAEVIVEGCIGETVAALVAARQLAWATDARTRAALERIAEDEAQHAELAWRFVRWAITMGGESARAAAREAFDRVSTTVSASDDDDIATDILHAYGRLTKSEREDAVRSALRDVVTPCARALLEPQYAPMSGGADRHLPSNVP